MDRLERMLALARRFVPGARFANKADSSLMGAIGVVVRPFNTEFGSRYVTVIGRTVWLPRPVDAWNRDDLAAVLGHEIVHMVDQRRYGPLFYLSYGAPPIGRTARAHWERRGYAVDLLLAREKSGIRGVYAVGERLVPLFAGPAYGFMWAGEVAAKEFLRPTIDAVVTRTIDAHEPYASILGAWEGAVKGVIVAGGYGTRFLPVTRVVPKELLPIVDRPAIDLVVSEFIEAGITDLLVISSRRKRSLEDWFDRDPELESVVGVARAAPPSIRTQFVRQSRMAGTGDAILLAREFAGRDSVVVAYPDDLFGAPNPTAALLAAHARTGRSILAAHDLRGEDVSRYGVLDVVSQGDDLVLKRFVEKPAPGTEPSTLVSWGRYVFEPAIFEALADLRRHHTEGEFFHVGAIERLAAEGRVGVEIVAAERFDTGVPLGYLKAVITFALARPDLGPQLQAWWSRR